MTDLEVYRSTANIPPKLAEAGVQMVERDGFRAIVIPPAIRQTHNVLTPQSYVAAAVPLWTPSVRQVSLDLEQHAYYHSQTKKYALNKQGLIELADLAGVSFSNLRRMPRSELLPTEIGYYVDVSVRGPDGTLKQLPPASRVLDSDDEFEVVLAQCRGDEAKAKARWVNEKRSLDAKCQTMTYLRGIRSALRVPHGFTKEDLAKPFLVVAYSFTPDYLDPEVIRLLTEKATTNTNDLYGTQPAALPAAPEPVYTPIEGEVVDADPVDPRTDDDDDLGL